MAAEKNTIFIFDNAPEDPDLSDYFTKFNYSIQQINTFILSGVNPEYAAAVLVNVDMISEPELLKTLYQNIQAPIILIGNKKNNDQFLIWLEEWADDFVPKPLHPRELHARINAISRRINRQESQGDSQNKDVYLFGEWRLYTSSRQLIDSHHQELKLSAGEFELLLAFVRQPQTVLEREFLLKISKNNVANPLDRRIDVQISRLRQKLEHKDKKTGLIKTIRNSGYLFTGTVTVKKESEEPLVG